MYVETSTTTNFHKCIYSGGYHCQHRFVNENIKFKDLIVDDSVTLTLKIPLFECPTPTEWGTPAHRSWWTMFVVISDVSSLLIGCDESCDIS